MHDQGEMHDRVSTHGEGVTDDTTEMSLLTRYIVALTNLYGVLPEEELVKIFSAQNEDQISLEELESWADNHSEELYGTPVSSAPGLFIHEDLMDVDVFKDLMMKKANKPYYVPEKEELLKYVNPHYPESTKELDALLDYIKKHLISNEEDALDIVEDIHDYCKSGVDMRSVMDLFNDYEVSFDSMEQVNEVLQLVTSVANNIRIWENNGYTPHEIFEKYEKPNMKPLPDKPFVYKGGEQTVVKGEKVGRNDPCPCGSGKKYKKCCLGKDLYH
jgi:preprotein translocase subunit SecA